MNFKIEIEAEEEKKQYFNSLALKVGEEFDLCFNAKLKGFDVSTEIETTPAMDLADRTETIIGPKGIGKRYRELYEEMKDRDAVIFRIFRELIEQEWHFEPDVSKRIEQAVKTALVLATEGVVVAPLDGVPCVKVSENLDGSKYVDIYYAGPIRAAGGTATVLPLILGDYARKLLGLERYKPTEDEIERTVEECQIYDEIFSRQYKLTDDEVRKIVRGCPVCINGEQTEEREVSVHRDLKRIPTNRVRGGMCLVISEGIALKARKILKYSKILKLDWSWLEDIIHVEKSDSQKIQIEPLKKYLAGLAAGRPIFAYPSRIGGFRLRYGRARNTGIMAKAIHPAVMYLLDEFPAVATQLKVERPGKAAEVFACDTIEGPIVKLADESVVQVNSIEEAIRVQKTFKKLLFLGDMLVSYGDFRYSAHPLVPAGFCEEWWIKILEKKIFEKKLNETDFEKILCNPNEIDGENAVKLSEGLGIPLHPKFLHYYRALDKKELLELVEAFCSGKRIEENKKIVEISFEKNELLKKYCDRIGLPHTIRENEVVVGKNFAFSLLKTFGYFSKNSIDEIGKDSEEDVLKILSKISGIEIWDKCGTFIGARMGRPEAAKPRKMTGNPHVLFPIALSGGNTRSINKAMKSDGSPLRQGIVNVDIALNKCPKCERLTPFNYCLDCNQRAIESFFCPKCKNSKPLNESKCPKCGSKVERHFETRLDLNALMHDASRNMGIPIPELIKGVKGIINSDKIAEPLEKGLLRAKHDLHIFRDGTIRYEVINAPLTQFKPSEIGLSVEKAKALGYKKDVCGKNLENENQLLELFPQDVVIPEDCGDFFVKVSKFIDDELQKFYKMHSPYFKAERRSDLVGEMVLGLAPHTSAAIVGRIIGFTKAKACFAHLFFHQCKRRNIDGDQDSLMLLMDGLLNFSQKYLAETRGGRMDAPLVFTIALKPTEIDDEVSNVETCCAYPLEFYEKALEVVPAESVDLEIVKKRLGKKSQYNAIGFTHNTSVFDAGPKASKYVTLKSMDEKIKTQAILQSKIRAINLKSSLERVLISHFLPDIIGNTRSFSRQKFRCTNCNASFRRIPLNGLCISCKKGNIILTIAQGSVRKYLNIAKEIVETYQLDSYLKQRIELIEEEINSVFYNEDEVAEAKKQKSLFEYV